MTAVAGHKQICLTRFEDTISALDNHCPHQGGPLGKGSIENGTLRCPWHGWDYHPCTGKAPGFDDGVETYEVLEKEDGIYVGIPKEIPHETTISEFMAETMINWGVNTVFGMVGHSNLGFADALKRLEQQGKLTGKPAACFSIAGPGAINMYTWLCHTSLSQMRSKRYQPKMRIPIRKAELPPGDISSGGEPE